MAYSTFYIALYDTSVGLKDGLYGSVKKSRFYNATALLSNYAWKSMLRFGSLIIECHLLYIKSISNFDVHIDKI